MTDESVVSTWRKALRTLHGSRHESMDADSAFVLAHQAALQGSLAVLRAAGCRVTGRDRNENPFSRVTGLDAGELSGAARTVDHMRHLTREVLRGSGSVDDTQLAQKHAAAGRPFAAAHAWLRAERPSLELPPPLA
jgi:hypothetical protein